MKKIILFLIIFTIVLSNIPVYAIKVTTPNIALNKPATADSVYSNIASMNASKAVDGDPNTYWSQGYSGRNAYLQVDLMEAQVISKVILYFRTDIDNPTGRKNFEIRLSNSADFKEYEVAYAQGADTLPYGQPYMMDISVKTPYRYIRYEKTNGEYAVINEMYVYSIGDQPKDYSGIMGKKYEKAVRLLDYIGVLNSDIFAPDEPITRAEAVRLVMDTALPGRVLNGDGYEFSDVDEDDEYYDAIMSGYKCGVINKPDDGRFRPRDYVTTQEMCKMVIYALNYGIVCEAEGGYSAGVRKLAGELRLLKNTDAKFNDILISSDAAILLYNMLSCEKLDIVFEFAAAAYRTDETLLKVKYGLEEGTGIISGTYFSELSQKGNVSTKSVKIGQQIFSDDTGLAYEYLGYSVDYFYDPDENAIKIFAPTDKNDIVRLYGKDLILDQNTFTNGYISSEYGEKTKKYRLEEGFDVIYNGVADNDFVLNSLEENRYNTVITLLDNDLNGQYDCMFVDERKVLIVRSVSVKDNEYIIVGEDNTIISGINDSDAIKIINLAGAYLSIESIEPGDVIEIAVSKDKSVTNAYIGYRVIEGTIEEINREEPVTITVDGNDFIVDQSYFRTLKAKSLYADELFVGQKYSFRVGHSGIIVGITERKQSEQTSYGVILRTAWVDTDDGEGALLAKTLCEDGNIKNLYFNEKFTLDGEKQKLDFYRSSNDYPVSKGVVKITLAGDVIKEIEILDEHDGTGLTYKNSLSVLFKINYKMQLRVTGSEPLFYVPVDESGNFVCDQDTARAAKLSSALVDETRVSLDKYYDYEKETKKAGAFVRYVKVGTAAYSVKETDPLMVVSKVDKYFDENKDEVMTRITGSGGTFYVKDSVSYKEGENTYYAKDLKAGDIISYNYLDNEIKAFILILDPMRDKYKMETKDGYTPWYTRGDYTYNQIMANQRVFYSVLTRKQGDVISLCDRIDNGLNSEDCDFRTEIYSVGTTPVYIYNEKNAKVVKGEMQNLDAYIYEVNPDARIAIATMRGQKKFIVIYDFE